MFGNVIGIAYEITEDFDTDSYLLQLYKVKLSDGQYKLVKFKKTRSLSYEPLYDLINKFDAKYIDYYAGQDFGRQLRKTRN